MQTTINTNNNPVIINDGHQEGATVEVYGIWLYTGKGQSSRIGCDSGERVHSINPIALGRNNELRLSPMSFGGGYACEGQLNTNHGNIDGEVVSRIPFSNETDLRSFVEFYELDILDPHTNTKTNTVIYKLYRPGRRLEFVGIDKNNYIISIDMDTKTFDNTQQHGSLEDEMVNGWGFDREDWVLETLNGEQIDSTLYYRKDK